MGGGIPPHEIVRELSHRFNDGITLFAPDEICQDAPFKCEVCSDVIEMDDEPLSAIRKKRNSSMVRGIEALKAGEIDAFVSLGNTGALVGSTKIALGMIEGWNRPALLTFIPTAAGRVAVLDVGASVDTSPDRYLELAQMGTMFLKNQGLSDPRIGLLNIGVEETKGRAELKSARSKLTELPNFIGNVESMDVFSGKIDLLLTDGFTGNIFLKTSEGLATFLLDLFARHIKLETDEVMQNINSHLTKNHNQSAILLGVNGLVLKCHGNAGAQEIAEAISWTQALL